MASSKLIKKNPVLWIVLLISLIIVGLYMCFTKITSDQDSEFNNIVVVHEWELPNELEEISGIAYLSENQIACVQDELGTIFIFDLSEEKITKKIHFGKEGDYEGITIVGNTAFVLRSDGSLFEIKDFDSGKVPGNTMIYSSPFPDGVDIEGLSYDENANRLLLLIKEKEKGNRHNYKEIYAFDLQTKSFLTEPVYKLEFPFENAEKKIEFQPSEIALNNNNLYVLISKYPAIVLYEAENAKRIFRMNKNKFPQPEGLTFGPNGKIFLSSEGSPGKLFEIELNNK